MQPIKISRTLFARLPGGTSNNLAEFVGHLNRRITYLDGIIAALSALRRAPTKQLDDVIDALEEEAESMRADAMENIVRMSKEIVGL